MVSFINSNFSQCVYFPTPQGNPPTVNLGSQATPMYFRTLPTPQTSTVFTKDQKLLWCKMVKPFDDHVLLDMNVTNSRAMVDLFQDCAITYPWMHLMCIPTSGTDWISLNPACIPGNKDIYSANLHDFKNLIKDFHHISLEQVMAFAS
jgi:hypothetical protein